MHSALLLEAATAEGAVARKVRLTAARSQFGSRALPRGHSAGAGRGCALQTLVTGDGCNVTA